MRHRREAIITDEYNAKGENRITLLNLYNGGEPLVRQGSHLTKYTISFHIVFPVIVFIFLGWLFHHYIENSWKQFFSKFRTAMNKNSKKVAEIEEKKHRQFEISTRNMYILITVVGSLTFIVYVLVLDCLALDFRNERVISDIFFKKGSSNDYFFQVDYAIPHIMFAYDAIILFVVLFVLSFAACGYKSWYYVFFGPCCCIVIHSYHIIIGFIHTPHHASGILIFYVVVFLVFFVSYKTAYYNLVHFAMIYNKWKKKSEPDGQEKELENCVGGSLEGEPSSDNSAFFCLFFCTDYRKCCISPKGCDCYKSPLGWLIVICFVLLSFFISGVLVFVVILFLIVPINLAIDDAPNRLLTIHQTILIFITAAITYKLYRGHKDKTILDQLVKANTKRLRNQGGNQQKDEDNQNLNQGGGDGRSPDQVGGDDRGPNQEGGDDQGPDQEGGDGQGPNQGRGDGQGPNRRNSNQPVPVPHDQQSNTTDLKTWESKHNDEQQIEMAGLLLDALLAFKQQGKQ